MLNTMQMVDFSTALNVECDSELRAYKCMFIQITVEDGDRDGARFVKYS